MTFYEMAQPAVRKTNFLDGIFGKLNAGMKAAQYGRMLQALSSLSEAQLTKIGIERKDIPAHARRCIYPE